MGGYGGQINMFGQNIWPKNPLGGKNNKLVTRVYTLYVAYRWPLSPSI